MPCLLTFFLCLLQLMSHSGVVVDAFDTKSIKTDLNNINLTCAQDSCNYHERDSLSSRACYCGMQCVQLDTCCIDSFYANVPQPKLKPSCRTVYGDMIPAKKTYYLIDNCPSTDSIWSKLCHDEWNEDDDVQQLVPVTSLLTSITYKNYYCFRCHEANDEFLYWIVNVKSNYDPKKISELDAKRLGTSLTYDKDRDTWTAIYDEEIGYFPVNISLQVPYEISKLTHVCEPDVVSDCLEEWSDEEVRNKCQSYMAIKEVKRNGSMSLKYKNIHCALCNFESLNDISCWSAMVPIFTVTRTQVFSFTHLLDINPSDGELVGKIQKCSNDHIWDPFTKKCRKLSCALPGYKIKNGKCVQE